MLHIPKTELKKALLASGFIDESQFYKAAEEADATARDITNILVEHGDLSEDYLADILAEYFEVEKIDLGKVKIDEKTLAIIPEKIARGKGVIPFEEKDGSLKVAMEDPGDLDAISFLEKKVSLKIIPYITTAKDFRQALGLYSKSIAKDFKKIIEANVKKSRDAGEDIESAAKDLPVINILNTIMEYALSEQASDIHIERLSSELLIRFRVDGILRDIVSLPSAVHPAIVARVKILADLKIDEHRLPQDGRFHFESNLEGMAVRVSVIPTFYGEKVVMRLLEESERFLTLEELGMSAHNLRLVEQAIKQPHGMILSTGPTGSGKTTTLYTILHLLNRPEVNISTIEDPIEYDIKRINQIQVNPKINLTFADGLRSLLRQDPDILMVGEIRDKETADMAVHSALTGHLLLSSLHTNDAPGAVPRLIDMGSEAYLLASTLNLVIAQRLVRKICTNCVAEVVMNSAQKKALGEIAKEGKSTVPTKIYKGKGCEECGGTGFKGRIGIFEVLEITPVMQELIGQKVSEEKIRSQALIDKMVTMIEDGFTKVESGVTSLEEVLRVIKE